MWSKPGENDWCGTKAGGHNFISLTGSVYCKNCGQTPGKSGWCGTKSSGHNFTSFTGSIYCKYCGQTPGKVIGVEPNLPDIISLHLQVVFCKKQECGQTPGKSDWCGTKSAGHSFEGY